ncbi:ADOP family duplicated permease [Occallatibacter riparius]|uniref:ADOP family duplicated permease n=1 Tax=Occallatibacter riparius TaxID=1002689 RepID=A0A9J7BVE5_9BACT|nr:ADOP family duplicated permease [Occallatibacter riparius]UWZ86655.1 ADOP family duplicated permease [Occallatibacter riparius]
MNALLKDARYALRQLRRSPGFTLTALLTLALGLGATAAVYSVVQSVLLEPLPYPDADRLVGLAFTFPHEGPNAEQTGAAAEFVRDHTDAFASVAVMDDGSAAVNLSVAGGRAEQVSSLHVSNGYFRTLGVMPAMGRTFSVDEDRPNGPRVAILSHGLWQRALNGDPNIVGRTVRINQDTFTVVGIMPASFIVSAESAPGVMGTPDLWTPLQLSPKDPGYSGDNYQMIGRLRPDLSLAQAQQQLSALQSAFYAQFPNYRNWTDESAAKTLHEFRAWKLQDVVVANARRSLIAVLGAVVAVLLVACLNLAGLMMARSMRRARELSLRTALGATRTRLVRLIAVEGLLLALAGGALGIVVARVTTGFLLKASPLPIPRLHGEPAFWLLSAVVLVLAVLSALVFAILPGCFALGSRSREARLNGPTLGETISHARISRMLVVAQVAMAVVLVSTASILLGTFLRLHALPSGVEQKQLSVFQVTLKGDRYASTQRTGQFVSTVLEELRHIPGVDRVAAVNGLPLDRGLNQGGNPADRRDLRQTVEFRAITPGYFVTMGMHLIAGRDITDADRAGSDRVVVIGASAARKWWPGRSPIGESVQLGGPVRWRIVGVVPDVQMHSLVEAQGIEIYGPMAQLSDESTAVLNGWFPTTFAIRTAAHVNLAASVQNAVEKADPEIPIARFTTMQDVIDSTIQAPRFFSMISAGFSTFALVLTIIGIFGLLSYQVTQRTREIGVRMALGASRRWVLGSYLRRGMVLTISGVALGLIVSTLLRPIVQDLLADAGIDTIAQKFVVNGVSATAIAVCAVVAATLAASWLPALRAASIEPMQALRTE